MPGVTRQSVIHLRALAAALESLALAFDSERPDEDVVRDLMADVETQLSKLEKSL